MKNKRRALRGAISQFAKDLRQVAQQLNDGVSFLGRSMQHKPCIGPTEFQEVVSEITDEVADLTAEVENLERFTIDTISFEELLGHCLALYQANRSTIDHLEEHLQDYGYQQPPGLVVEPENPLSAEAVAAARARLGGSIPEHDGGSSGSDDDEDDDDWPDEPDNRCPTDFFGAMASSRKAFALAPATNGAAPLSFCTKGRRKGTPAANARVAALSDSDREDDVAGGGADKHASDNERDARPCKRHQQQQRTHLPSAGTTLGDSVFGRSGPTGSVSGKSHILLNAQAASQSAAIAAAASVHASARKAPLSRARHGADRDSFSPEPALSPGIARILAKYNPPASDKEESDSDGGGGRGEGLRGDRVSISLAASFDMACVPVATCRDAPGAKARAEELSAAMRDLAPFGQHRASSAVAAVEAALRGSMHLHQAQQQQPPAADEETCALYRQLIRSNLDGQKTHPQQQHKPQQQQQPPQQPPQQQTLRASVPALNIPGRRAEGEALGNPPKDGAPQQARGGLRGPIPSVSPRPPMPYAAGGSGNTPEGEMQAATSRSRAGTPLSARRVQNEEHNRKLAERYAELQQTLVSLTPMGLRRSIGGDLAGHLRAKSPGPARAALEAGLPVPSVPSQAASATASVAAAAAAAASAAAAAAVAAAAASQPRVAWSSQPTAQAQKEADAAPRVLSPLQPSSLAQGSMAATNPSTSATTPHRAGRNSGLPAPPQPGAASGPAASLGLPAAAAALPAAAGAAATTTVVGATVLSRGDVNLCELTLRGAIPAAIVAATSRSSPVRAARGQMTPSRKAKVHVPSSPPTPGSAGAAAPPARGTEAATPRGPGRVPVVTSTAAAAEARASKHTPSRRSYTGASIEAAVAAAAATATIATIDRNGATPGRARRIATLATAAAAAGTAAPGRTGTPGRNRGGTEDSGASHPSQGLAGRVVATARAPPVVPHLRVDTCQRTDDEGGWQGFQHIRMGADGGTGADARQVMAGTGKARDAGAVDEVTLAMPPSPMAMTPTPDRSGGASGARAAAIGTTVLSPGAAKLASHPLGDINGGPNRPVVAASRIPTPGKARSRLPGAPTAAHAVAPGTGGGPPSTAGASPASLEPCSEDEWRGLPATLQHAFPLEALNGHLRGLANVISTRLSPSDTAGSKTFSAADVEALSLSSMDARRFLNTLVKLGRCQVVGGGGIGGGAMVYRLSA